MKTTKIDFTTIKLTLLAVLTGLILTAAAQAATLTVTKTADTNDTVCDADCSLREAFDAADGNGRVDTINSTFRRRMQAAAALPTARLR